MSYSPYYPSGWLTGESGNTPITPASLNYMEQGIVNAQNAAETAQTAANTASNNAKNATDLATAALPKAGGTLTGMLILTENVHYGDTLPAAGNKGRIFFKRVSE